MGTSAPVKLLRQEHDRIRTLLAVLERVGRAKSTAGRWLHDAELVLDWLETFNVAHHRKEERVLSVLKKRGLHENGQLARFWAEHEQGELVFGTIRKALDATRSGAQNAADKARHGIQVLGVKYRDHMEGEEELLFPAAKVGLEEADIEQLTRQFDQIDCAMFRVAGERRVNWLDANVRGDD